MELFLLVLLFLTIVIAIGTLWIVTLYTKHQHESFYDERVGDILQRCPLNGTASPYNIACPSTNLNYAPSTDVTGEVTSNVILRIGEKIASPSGSVELYFMRNGNLVLQQNNFNGTYTRLWESKTQFCGTTEYHSTTTASGETSTTTSYCAFSNTPDLLYSEKAIPYVELNESATNAADTYTTEYLYTKLILLDTAATASDSKGEFYLEADDKNDSDEYYSFSLANVGSANLKLLIHDDGTMTLNDKDNVVKKTFGESLWS